jgi:hypothetical protein
MSVDMSVVAWVMLGFVLGALLSLATIIAAFCGIAADTSSGSERKSPGGKTVRGKHGVIRAQTNH